MQPTQTGIATALALVVIAFFFFFGGAGLFTSSAPATEATTNSITTNPQPSPTIAMPTDATSVTQLQVTDETIGTGAAAAAGDTVTVNYVGSLLNGTVFDASANHSTTGFSFTLGVGQVIQGWDQGIAGMKVGGKRKLVIPAALAYGNMSPAPSIPANSPLVFEVELLKVQK